MIHCITTMSRSYYDLIGKLMIKSWSEFFPSNYQLHLYLEGFEIELNDPKIKIEDYSEVQKLWDIWWNKRGSDNDRHQKFTKKACTQIVAWEKLKEGKTIWFDADMVFLKPVPVDLFDKVLTDDCSLASWGDYSFESGTVFLNLSHHDSKKIIDQYKEMYVGSRGLPDNERWFDGELLGRAVKDSDVNYMNLNKLCTSKTNTPLNGSWLAEYMIHFKAKRKNTLHETILNKWRREDLYQMYISN